MNPSASKTVKLDFNLERDVPELNGKVLLTTGGTNGLGAAAAKMLASRHPAKIYITGRNQAAAQQTIDSIKSSTGSATQLEWIRCDHANLATVKEAAEKILAKESRLDVLMANAGIMALPRGLTSDGYELHFGINHLAHALLIRKLLPLLQKTAKTHLEARIIPLCCLIAEILEGKAPRIYGLVWKIGVFYGKVKYLTYEMVRLGYVLTGLEAEEYLQTVTEEAKEMTMTA
ncbi:hypothetical protein INS49_009568 [Diaporthe citri]|uniref:uncharacterized protein n=1 Tax=Diaporthe citri TaxID=83186 RepID=UPI001C7F7795|nr:uncharacterized protein INS49_009568 [Diaporthe citri]KAG6361343.1 hypothetical protein INS49_009568 [Diaporthe citri]